MNQIVKKTTDRIREGDALGWTHLHYAAQFGNVNAIQFVLKDDSSAAYIPGKGRESALHIAAFRGLHFCHGRGSKSSSLHLRLARQQGKNCSPCRCFRRAREGFSVHFRVPDLVGLVKEVDEDGNTPLHLAATYQKYSIIAILARDSQVDIKVMNKKNLTALRISRKYQKWLCSCKGLFHVERYLRCTSHASLGQHERKEDA